MLLIYSNYGVHLFSLSHSCLFIIDKNYYGLFEKKLRKIIKLLIIFRNKLKSESDLIFRNGGSDMNGNLVGKKLSVVNGVRLAVMWVMYLV